jgi:Coenzyme PQQ synthesis protein D (PqqD)
MKTKTEKLPQARQDELFVERMGEELLVYDAKRHSAHRLNPTAAWVWSHCDGQKTIAETTRLLSDELQQPMDEELVWLSLETLDQAHLLSTPIQHPPGATDESRRAMIQKLAMAGGLMFLLPAITPLSKAVRAQESGSAVAFNPPIVITVDIGTAIKGVCNAGSAVRGESAGLDDKGNGIGVQGVSTNNFGVSGRTNSKEPSIAGVYGESRRLGTGGAGVRGDSRSGYGVMAVSENGIGLYAEGKKGQAGFFKGDVEVTGDIRLTNADCAEDFDIVDAESIEAGTVMVLCDEGALQLSEKAYDKRVAGVISGAGDYKPGLILDKKPTGRPRKPVALMGKVFCKADARYGAIEAGDLLTTSDTPGHAMKAVDPTQAFGAVVGKALRALTEGQGLIPILVSLQ